MPHRNRVTPFGEIVAIAQRGTLMGNRGVIHEGTTIVRPWQHSHWISCQLSYKDWRAPMWEPRRWTALFFLDEAVALGAGHRPCALCRRPAYNAFVAAWPWEGERRDAIDKRLHAERRTGPHRRPWRELPVGAYVVIDEVPLRVEADALAPWTEAGYGPPRARPARGDAVVLTPPAIVDALRAGYSLL